jgi:cyclomaltodextrinase
MLKILKSNLEKLLLLLITLLLITFSTENSIKHPEWSFNKTIYEVNIRQYTEEGTFNAFAEHLPEIKKMGIGIIWLMPIHPIGELNRKGTLGSYYSVRDYKAVNPEFGTDEDFRNLVKQIHEMDMYVIIDWVANHTAWDHPWTKDHPEYYNTNQDGEFLPPVDDWSDVIDLNYDNTDLRREMIDALKFWVEEYDIDGFRCDVAAMVPLDFWINARMELDTVKDVFMLAEASEPELHAAFDMTYNWQLKDLLNEIAKGEKTAAELIDFVETEKDEYKRDDFRMLFTTNHDENTWNGTVFERLGESAEVSAVLISTAKGMPLVYSGQEAGLNKNLSFFEKDVIEWKEHKFRNIFTKLFQLKKNNKALFNGNRGGEMNIIPHDHSDKLFAFYREKEKDRIIALLNFSKDTLNINLNNHNLSGQYTNLFENDALRIDDNFKVEIEPWHYKVYYKK